MYLLFVKRSLITYLYWINAHYKHMPNDVLKLLIDSLVLSRLTYALPVWGPAISKQYLTRLQRQHNWAVHIVKNLKKFDHVSAHRTELGWLPVDALIRYRTLCTMHQLYHRTFTYFAESSYIVWSSTYLFNTVSSYICKHYEVPSLTDTVIFRYQSAKWWNALPEPIVVAHDFSSSLYNYLLYG